jgi:hypothetical protein
MGSCQDEMAFSRTKFQEPNSSPEVLGFWNLVLGIWFLEFGF